MGLVLVVVLVLVVNSCRRGKRDEVKWKERNRIMNGYNTEHGGIDGIGSSWDEIKQDKVKMRRKTTEVRVRRGCNHQEDNQGWGCIIV